MRGDDWFHLDPRRHLTQLPDLGSPEGGEALRLSFGGARLGLSDGVSTLPRPVWGLEGVLAGVISAGTSLFVLSGTGVPSSLLSPLMFPPLRSLASIFGGEEARRRRDGDVPGEVGELDSEGLEEGGDGSGEGRYLRNDRIWRI